MNLDPLTVGIAAILLVILVFSIIKGFLKMFLLALAISASIFVWLALQRHGFTYLAFITSSPRPWMVQALSWAAALFTFLVLHHGLRWFSMLFSFRKASPGMVVTSVLMSGVMLWALSIGISYYADIQRIAYCRDCAAAAMAGQAAPELPTVVSLKDTLRSTPFTAHLTDIDPLENPAQANLACLVAYGCTLDEARYTAFYNEQILPLGFPQPTRFLDLFGDPGLRTLVQEGRFVTLLENERLTTFAGFCNTAELLIKYPFR
ncbi:MAG: hypothetical protein MR890_00060 [Akkermansia muciniphila]|nr:hypothetical protein [Akkermansia muciniphila]